MAAGTGPQAGRGGTPQAAGQAGRRGTGHRRPALNNPALNNRAPVVPAHDFGFAPAKVNLCLHVTGTQPDGYHLLDSLVVFAAVGDQLQAHPATTLTLELTGPFGPALATAPDNLVLRAARALAETYGRPPAARLLLAKHLPPASGIGGGSADAAASLRLLSRLWNLPAAEPALALRLGADVPVCLARQPARMRGIGEHVEPCTLPACGLLLANPGVPVATAAIFTRLAEARRAPGATGFSPPLQIPPLPHVLALAAWLRTVGNDLQAPAIEACPPIATVLAAIQATPGCLLARMSGSGATCFGLFATEAAAAHAAAQLGSTGWWVWGGGTFA